MRTMKRQGDVLLIPIEEHAADLRRVPLDNGRVILAYGEATGHAHAVIGDVELLASDIAEMEDRFLRVEASMTFDVPIYGERPVVGHATERVVHEDGDVLQEIGDPIYGEAPLIGHETVAGAQVVHEEHGTVPLEAGLWKVRRQREYAPEEIRFVAD